MVSSTTPRLLARWPPFFPTTSIIVFRISCASWEISFLSSFFISAGDFIVGKIVAQLRIVIYINKKTAANVGNNKIYGLLIGTVINWKHTTWVKPRTRLRLSYLLLCRFLLSFFLRLCVAIFWRFLFFPQGTIALLNENLRYYLLKNWLRQ